MKIYKILNNTAAVLAALAIASCAELEEKPESSMVSQQFYNTEADAVAAVNAVYADLNPSGQSIYNSLFQIGVEMATDDYMAGPRARNAHVRAISSLIHDPSNDRMQELWRQSYALIKRCQRCHRPYCRDSGYQHKRGEETAHHQRGQVPPCAKLLQSCAMVW